VTVAIGLVCSDGVLVASDSMSSDGHVAGFGRKVHTFGRTPAIWTMSGSVYVAEEVTYELERLDASGTPDAPPVVFTKPDLPSLRSKLTTSVKKGVRTAYDGALGVPQGQIPNTFMTNFLVLGYSNGTPWFLEYAYDGQINWHTDLPGFYSTGSGGEFAAVARGLMGHYLTDPQPLDLGKMIAYRTIATTIEVSSQSVGFPVQIAVCDDEGARILTDEELDEVATGVERWKQLERDTLRQSPEEAQGEARGDLPTMDL
jgi:20S proteasome alpha/beta subunit